MTADDDPKVEKRKRPLLEKYDIPLTHLDFAYVKDCSNIVELERIIQILRSNEEGCYPELLASAEERLRELSPYHRVLRTTTPVLSKHQLSTGEWEALQEELTSWKNEVSDVERKLSRWKDCPEPPTSYPHVRRPPALNSTHQPRLEELEVKEPVKSAAKCPVATDYRKWDMYDAETECLKMDLAVEREEEERQRMEVEEAKAPVKEEELTLEEQEVRAIANTIESMTLEEREVLSLKEKNLGNEFYQRNRHNNALRHYTRSICLHPTSTAYNNRAATYLKQCRFSKALDDLNIVLEMDPNNVKAHFRRALAFQHKNEFEKALEDILVVLKYEPRHVLARHIADQLRENCAALPRKFRIKVRDEKNPTKLTVKEVTEEEIKRDYKDIDYLEVNETGLPKIMCNCNGKYTNDPIMKNNDPLKYQHIWYNQEKARHEKMKAEEQEKNAKQGKQPNVRVLEDSTSGGSVTKRNKPLIQEAGESEGKGGGMKRLEIMELEKVEEEEQSTAKPLPSGPIPTPVLDMQTNWQQKTFFGGYIEGSVEPRGEAPKESSPCKTKVEKTSFNIDMQASDRSELENNSSFKNDSGNWDSIPGYHSELAKTSPQSPLSNNSSNGEFSSDMESDTGDLLNRVERLMENDIDTISLDLFPDGDLVKCECGEGYSLRSPQFLGKWHAFANEPDILNNRSRLIRLLCPHQLSGVIGTNLDEGILSGFISCLSYHFDSETEKDKIISYLESISSLQRFGIIKSFLSQKDKTVMDNLLRKLHPVNSNIKEAFLIPQ